MTAEHHTLAKYFVELNMVDYEMVHFPPSQVASAAFALTLKVFSCGEWVRSCASWVLLLQDYLSSSPLLPLIKASTGVLCTTGPYYRSFLGQFH